MKTDHFNAYLSISEVHSSTQDDYVQIEISDKDSGCLIAQLKLTHHDFACAVFSHSHTPAEGRLGENLDKVGMDFEHKEETVGIFLPASVTTLNDTYQDHSNLIKKAVKPLEVDGWKARIKDAFNHRNYQFTDASKPDGSRISYFRIGFDRWVEVAEFLRSDDDE